MAAVQIELDSDPRTYAPVAGFSPLLSSFDFLESHHLASSGPDQVIEHADEFSVSGTSMAGGDQFKIFELSAF